MQFSQDELSDFLTHYSTIGDTIKVDSHRLEEASYIGYGEMFFPTRSLEFSIHIVDERELTDTICMTEMDDFGSFEILIHRSYLSQAIYTQEYKQCLEVACLRQLTRFAISEMPTQYKDITHSTLGLGQSYKDYPALLDYKPEVQAFFRNQFIVTESFHDKNAYMNAVATALLYGGVIIREYEVDLETLRFLSREQLIAMNQYALGGTPNNAIAAELKNRINRLTHAQYNGNVIHPEFELTIHLN